MTLKAKARLKVLLPGEGEGGGKLEDGEVIVGGGAVIGGVGQPRAGGDGDLAVTGVSVVMLTHNNPDMENGSLFWTKRRVLGSV